MRFILELSLDDAELAPDESEYFRIPLSRILRDLAFDIEYGKPLETVSHDINGNVIGRAYVDESPVTPKSRRTS